VPGTICTVIIGSRVQVFIPSASQLMLMDLLMALGLASSARQSKVITADATGKCIGE
jgi:hypothetical protein